MATSIGWLSLIFGFTTLVFGATPRDAALSFEQNLGQADPSFSYLARGPQYTLLLSAASTTLRAEGALVKMDLVGANPSAVASGLNRLPTHVNYLMGNDQAQWHTDIPTYGKIYYKEVYPSVDLVYYGREGHLEYDLVLHPGASLARIRLHFEGARNIENTPGGDLVISTDKGEFRHLRPKAYQTRAKTTKAVAGRYVLLGTDEVVFDLDDYDRTQDLVLDPSILYSTYLGGAGNDAATSIAMDAGGNAYVTGYSESVDLPGGAGSRFGRGSGLDVYVAKLNATGKTMSYITYLGGSMDDRAFGIAVDNNGSAVVAGWTYSPDFPVVSPFQAVLAGGRDAFVAKLNSSGNGLIFSTYLGGTGYDSCNGVAVDVAGSIYLAGETSSISFPTDNAIQRTNGGGQDAFIAKISSSGALQYSTYLGGNQDDRATAIAVDPNGNAYVTGSTYSPNFPVVNAVQSTLGGGQDAFVAKLNATGYVLIYSTYIGGSGGTVGLPETGYGIAVDGTGYAYVAGTTSSSNFPTANPFQPTLSGSQDAFVIKLSPSGNSLAYGTYLGGHSIEIATGIAVDSAGSAYVTGYTASSDFPTANALQVSNAGSYDAFLARLGSLGNTLLLATYLGGTGSDSANGIALDAGGNAYLAGQTLSSNFPVSNAMLAFRLGTMSGFVTKMSSSSGLSYTISGQITVTGTNTGLSGVVVSLSGSTLTSTATDTSGFYSFPGLALGGGYTITPSRSGYTFVPVSSSVSNLRANQNLTFVAVGGSGGFNLASGKVATQSSTLISTGGASNAVDGNTDGNFSDGSVTHTNFDPNAWWQIDIGSSASIGSIVIWNRTDNSCGNRLGDYWIFVSDTPFGASDTPTNLQSRWATWSNHQTSYPNPFISIPVSARGRYIRIQQSGTQFLSLAEVQVYGSLIDPNNLATGKAATQSSTWDVTAGASNALDGNTDGNFSDGSVTHTKLDTNAWWQVDLGGSAWISSVVIWNRTDSSCGNRLGDYWVFVSDTPFGTYDSPATLQARQGTWSRHQAGYPNPNIVLAVNAQGRYVRIQQSGTQFLSLAEVQVYGSMISAGNLAAGKIATQSSTWDVATGASNAVDGRTDGNYYNSSITHTNLDPNAWWQVDLGTSASISSIVIWNRTDNCSGRLGDYWVFISDIPFGTSDTPTTLQYRQATWSNHQTSYPNPSSTITVNAYGRFVRVQQTGMQFLSLAEVQVYGQ